MLLLTYRTSGIIHQNEDINVNILLSPDDEDPSLSRLNNGWHRLKKHPFLTGVGLSLFIFFLLLIQHFWPKHAPKKPIFPVVTAMVERKTVPVYLNALGNVVATYTVTLKTQINGYLMSVLYKEGQFVKKGDVLAEIDDRLLKAQLMQYEGQLKRDEALLANALIDLHRYQVLWKQDSVSQQTLATQESLVKQYQGDVELDKGLIESTKVNLIYTRIIAPVDGRIGLRLVDPGNFVQTTDTSGLAVITTINPTTVIFTLPEDDIPSLLSQTLSKKTIPVKAYDRQQNRLLAAGTLLTMDNQIDTSTGTVKLRAQFDNKNNALFSNQFVNIKILADTLHNTSLVPTAAIQHGANGDFVYVVTAQSTVKSQPIITAMLTGDRTVIKKGLTPGERVVTEGADKLKNGVKVKVINQE